VHDLNNVLGQVLGFGALLVRDIEAARASGQWPRSVDDYARELLEAGRRGEAVAREIGAIVRSAPASGAGVSRDSGTRLRILLVGDGEPGDRLAAAFERVGWSVERQAGGADALRSFRAAPAGFDAVVTRQPVADLAGVDLVSAVKALSPATTCVLLLEPGAGIDETAARMAGADATCDLDVEGLALVGLVGALGWSDRRSR
jgi:hypothetical protein